MRSWAWGCSGHEVVTLIALDNLKALDNKNHTKVTEQVETLLASQDHSYPNRYCKDLGLDPIAFFATWADDHRQVDPSTGNWHFWDIPLSVPSAKLGEYCADGCVVQALQQQLAALKDRNSDQGTRSTALLYVLHFMGDMHQPLHEEDNNDRGGNCVPVTFEDKGPESKGNGNYAPNLHGLWDTELVETVGGITRTGPDAKRQLEAFAARLEVAHGADIRRALQSPVALEAWANDAHRMARKDPYAKLEPAIAPISRVSPVKSCLDGDTSAMYLDKHETMSAQYVNLVKGDVEGQLSKAGARLAAALYEALK